MTIHPSRSWFTCRIRPTYGSRVTRFCARTRPGPSKCPEPLCMLRVLPITLRPRGPRQQALPTFFAPTGSCARPKRSARLRSPLLRTVFAACRHSLLRVGPSRRYSADLSPIAWTHTPAVLSVLLLVSSQETAAFADGKAARQPTICATTTSVTPLISGLQSFANVQAFGFARHPGRTHRSFRRAAVAFTSPHILLRYLREQGIC
jgi:hypothetical protein